jgi:molecular chaperone DnaK
MSRMIGIDLGTTNSCVALLEGGRASVLRQRDGERLLPSVVAYADDGQIILGHAAQRQAALNPRRTIYGAKRLIGRKFDDPAVQWWRGQVPYEIAAAENGDARIRIDGELISPEQIAAHLLGEMRQAASAWLREEVTEAVVTVPAQFNDRQRQATKDAGRIAGLEVRHILNEPTAAALAFGASRGDDERLAVFDLGGGTLDITILNRSGSLYEVLGTSGDAFLGGEDVDLFLTSYLLRVFRETTGEDLSQDMSAWYRLKQSAEAAKKALSGSSEVAFNLPFVVQGAAGPLHLKLDAFKRSDLETMCSAWLTRVAEPCYQALRNARLKPDEIDRVLLAGGMTRMPAVQEAMRKVFQRAPEHQINPDEIVALGAAAQCGILTGELEGVTLLDVTPHSLGVRINKHDMRVIVPRNASVPVAEERSFTTTLDYQEVVKVEVYQGEDANVEHNTRLGELRLTNLPRARAGQLEIVVTFLIDADGILQVRALEQKSGAVARAEIAPDGGLTRREVQLLTRRQPSGAAAPES